ncbi:hypothetical protein KCU92_g10097, partial [Aureobasidium melanogenum]
MRTHSGLAMASLLAAATALALNGTVETVTVTQTSWSTIVSTIPCPAPTTVTLCNSQCAAPTSKIANNANIVYQTLSECQAGQVITIGDKVTTLTQPTTLAVEKTISNLVFIPDSAAEVDYSAAATVTDIVYPSSMTGSSGQVVTCQTGVTTIVGSAVTLTNCPCTVKSTVLELTATGIGAVPTALVPSTNYIVKIIYVYVIESIVEQIPTTLTATATSILTTTQTETAIDVATTTTMPTSRPTIVSINSVTFLLEYDTLYDGVAVGNLRKRQAGSLPGISAELNACLTQCAQQSDCVATSLDENTSSCSPLVRFNAQSRRDADGNIFAIVIFRPLMSTSSSASMSLPGSTDRQESSASTRIKQQDQLEQSSISDIQLLVGFGDFQVKPQIQLKSLGPSVRFVERSHDIDFNIHVNTLANATSIFTTPSSGTTSTKSISSTFSSISSLSSTTSVANSSAVSTTSASSTSSSSVPPFNGCAVASDLAEYAPAMSYCSSVYPLTASTSLFDATTTEIITMSAAATTISSNITLIADTTVQTDEATITETSYFPTELTVTESTTITTTVSDSPILVQKRQTTMPTVRASVFSSILTRPSSDVALVCSCLQTPTITSITVTQTASIQTIVTPIVKNNVTITPAVLTLQTTKTATTTVTETITTATTTLEVTATATQS